MFSISITTLLVKKVKSLFLILYGMLFCSSKSITGKILSLSLYNTAVSFSQSVTTFSKYLYCPFLVFMSINLILLLFGLKAFIFFLCRRVFFWINLSAATTISPLDLKFSSIKRIFPLGYVFSNSNNASGYAALKP